MILIEYAVNAVSIKDNTKYELGVFLDYDEAWDYVAHKLDWQPDAVKEDWYFQVVEIEVEEHIFEEDNYDV